MANGYYPENVLAPMRTFLTTDAGQPIRTEYTGAVSAGQEVACGLRSAAAGMSNLMVNISGIVDAADIQSAYVTAQVPSPSSSNPGTFAHSVSLQPCTAGGATAWIGAVYQGPEYELRVKFRNARAAVVIRSQEFTY